MQARFGGRLFAAMISLAMIAGVGPVRAETVSCQRATVKAGAQFVQARMKALAKCHEKVVKTGAGSCPDAIATNAIDKATSKLTSAIDKACGGEDRVCGGDPSGEDTPASLGWPGTCPNFERGDCRNAIQNCGDIAECMTCVGAAAVDQAIGLTNDDLVLPSTGDPTLNGCQRAIGKATATFLVRKSMALRRCWDGRLAGKHGGSCVAPDPGDGKYLAAIAKAEDKKRRTICRACGGADKDCGGGDDLASAAIGFPADCPSVTIPGGSACGGPVADLQGIVDCVDCVAEFKADCVDRIQLPGLVAYPSDCQECPVVPSGPCPTSLELTSVAGGPNFDLGFTGLAHRVTAPVPSRTTYAISGCAGASQPGCGQCALSGPIANAGGAGFDNHRCADQTWVACANDGDCTSAGAAGPCVFFLGPPLAMNLGGFPICLVNEIAGPVSGTLNVDDGSSAMTLPLAMRVFVAGTHEQPCPVCDGGVCSEGPRDGMACTPNASGIFGAASFDCPPTPGALVTTLTFEAARSTADQAVTVTTDQPLCRQSGYTSRHCLCDTCNNAAAESCSSNADCPPSGGDPGVCGGRRCMNGPNVGAPCAASSECPGGSCSWPGEATQPNTCLDDTAIPGDGSLCQDVGDDQGECPEGPYDLHCSLEPSRFCADDLDCACPSCLPDQTCLPFPRPCFTDSGIVGNSVTASGTSEAPCDGSAPIESGALVCLRPPSATIVNLLNPAAGLPGLGRYHAAETMVLLP